MKYRREIDGLRALAVVPVVLFHAGFSLFSGGYVGVDVFFVISGYLITTILLSELHAGKFSIVRFYERRARRILPALFFVILCCVPLALLWMVPSQLKSFSQALIAIPLFGSNVLFWRKADYFAPAAEENPLLHTWTLAVEEQFYIIFPLLLVLLWRSRFKSIFLLIVCLSVLSFLLSEWGWRNLPAANFYLLPSRAWELGVGALCAVWLYRNPAKESDWLSLLGLGLILSSMFIYDKNTPFPSVYALAPVLGAAFIVLFTSTNTLVGKLLSHRYLVGVGLISFSIYLWHQPLFAFARIRTLEHPPQALMLMLVFLSGALSYLTWRFVEQPFRNKQNNFWTRRAIFSISSLAACVFISAGVYGFVSHGLPDRFDLSQMQKSYLSSALASPERGRCHSDAKNLILPENACRYGGGDASIAVFGDSHAVELAYELGKKAAENDMGVRHFSFSACGPAYRSGNDDICTQWTDKTIDYIVGDANLRYVVISYRLTQAFAKDHYGVYPDVPEPLGEQLQKSAADSLSKLIQALTQAGKDVLLVQQAPELRSHLRTLVVKGKGDANIVGVTSDWWEKRYAFTDRLSIPREITTIDTSKLFCREAVCFAGEDGVAFYFDDDHLSLAGAKIVVGKVWNSLSKMFDQ